MNTKVVYLMRGLPSCGKSYSSRRLAGATGVICETDEFFYTQVGDDPTSYDFREGLMEEARRWNLQRYQSALKTGATPIVVDRGNSLSLESQVYARLAVEHGYQVELREPESAWWQEIRLLLQDKDRNRAALYAWADRLAETSRSSHRVPSRTIRHWMDKWKWDLTIDDILRYRQAAVAQAASDESKGPAQVDRSFLKTLDQVWAAFEHEAFRVDVANSLTGDVV